MQLDPRIVDLAGRLGWSVRETGDPAETLLGDYARGYLLLQTPRFVQVARRSVRTGPSLKLWTPDPVAAQKYVAYATARLVRWTEGRGPYRGLPLAPAAVPAPFRLEVDDQEAAFLLWPGGDAAWAGFGRGGAWGAVQFAQYAGLDLDAVIRRGLDG